jgi:hypothetical protein
MKHKQDRDGLWLPCAPLIASFAMSECSEHSGSPQSDADLFHHKPSPLRLEIRHFTDPVCLSILEQMVAGGVIEISSQVKWPLRMATVLLVCLTDALVVMFAPRPLLWAILIPALTPLLTVICRSSVFPEPEVVNMTDGIPGAPLIASFAMSGCCERSHLPRVASFSTSNQPSHR